MSIAETIADQIGGSALYMLGASYLMDLGNGFSFKTMRTPAGKANHVKVVYNEVTDVYCMEFRRFRGKSMPKVIAEIDGVHAEQMGGLIEKYTGLCIKL